jgi:nitrogen fixation protein FixH
MFASTRNRASAMLGWEADVDDDASQIRERVRQEAEAQRRSKTVNLGRLTVQDARGFPVVPEASQCPLDPQHFSGKLLVAIVAAITLAVAISAHSLSIGVLAVEIVVGLLLASNAWGVRQHLPMVNSESKSQAAVGWIGLLVVALVLRQIAAPYS